jgi:hypothetical protein
MKTAAKMVVIAARVWRRRLARAESGDSLLESVESGESAIVMPEVLPHRKRIRLTSVGVMSRWLPSVRVLNCGRARCLKSRT